MKILLVFLFTFLPLLAIEIDYKTLEEIVQDDPHAYREKTLLAKYYISKDNNLKAQTLLDDVLKAEPKNRQARSLKKVIQNKEKNDAIFREAGLSKPIQTREAQKRLESYYSSSNYQFFSTLYQALIKTQITLDDDYHVKAAYVYLWDSRYKLSKKALSRLAQEKNVDAAKIRADICYYIGKYDCAIKLYEKLYNSSYRLEYAIKLMNSYIYMGNIQKAQRLHTFLYRKHPNNKDLREIAKKLSASKDNYLLKVQKDYENEQNIKTLSAYSSALYATSKREKAIEVVHAYNIKSASNKSLILEAKYLVWSGNTKSALEILRHGSLNDDLNAKLMLGQIYSWNQEFEKSKTNLNEVIVKSKDKELLFNARKARAYVYMWEKENNQAKKLFKKLLKEQAKDKEIQEALLELNHQYPKLIQIYKNRVSKSANSADIKHLGELYILNKEPNKAIGYYKTYVTKNPNDLEVTKALALQLVEAKKYYEGFGYLEYYAAQKQTADAAILLAKNYYWHGFSKEALDVLNALLKNEAKNKEALNLKAKILKISPRFTTSNSGATTGMFFDDLGKKQLFLADTLYFNAHYKASLAYYRDYLQMHPNNHDVRYRYAFALENSKEYGKAEGEFSLLFWTKDSDELKYHYAYNMMKNGKLKKANELLNKLKKDTFKKADAPLKIFLDSWKKSWQSQKFAPYAAHYDTSFLDDDMWSFRKQQTFKDVTYIAIAIFDPIYKQTDKESYIVRFYQEYSTNKKSDKGYKTLHLNCDNTKLECKITKESWEAGEYKKPLLLTPYIDRSLKESAYLKTHPLALLGKKKSLYLL